MNKRSVFLLSLLILFSNGVFAITPETFRFWTELWIAKNSWQTNLLCYKDRLALAKGLPEGLSASDKFIKNFLDLFEQEVVLSKFDLTPTMPIIDRAFIFIDKVIEKLTDPENKIALPESALCNDIFSAEDLSSIVLILFSLETDQVPKINQFANLFCQRIFANSNPNQDLEVTYFWVKMLENLSEDNLINFFSNSPLIKLPSGTIFDLISYFVVTGKVQINFQLHCASNDTAFSMI